MRLNKQQRMLVIIGLAIVVLFANIFLFFNPLYAKVERLKNTYSQNKTTIETLQSKAKNKDQLDKQNKFLKYELIGITEKLPNYLVPEKFVMTIKNLVLATGVQAENITFTKPEAYDAGIKPSYDNVSNLAKKADDVVIGYYKNDKDEGERANAIELQYGSIADESPIKVAINFKFSGSYDQIKNFVSRIENLQAKVEISNININSKDKSNVEGNIGLNFYGIKDSKVPEYESKLWNSITSQAKTQPFSTDGANRYDITKYNTSDFDIALNPHTYDLPTVVIGQHGDVANKIFGDNKGIENVELYVIEKGGKFYYKYKTESLSYPGNYVEVEFKPVTNSDIIVKVYSKERISADDNSGINLTIYNQTNKNINIVPYNDDPINPRLSVTIRK